MDYFSGNIDLSKVSGLSGKIVGFAGPSVDAVKKFFLDSAPGAISSTRGTLENNMLRTAGGTKLFSYALTGLSGHDDSETRIAGAALAGIGYSFYVAFGGEYNPKKEAKTLPQKILKTMDNHPIEITSSIMMGASLFFITSGIIHNRPGEVLKGLFQLAAHGVNLIVPEKKIEYDNGSTKYHNNKIARGFGKGWDKLTHIRHKPSRLSSILSMSSALSTIGDGFEAQDIEQAIAGLALVAGNIAFFFTRKLTMEERGADKTFTDKVKEKGKDFSETIKESGGKFVDKIKRNGNDNDLSPSPAG